MWNLVAIALIAIAGGALPLLVRWTERHLHTALALSTGIFLGAVFLHFLPSLSTMRLVEHEHATAAVEHEAGTHVHADGSVHTDDSEHTEDSVHLKDVGDEADAADPFAHPHGDVWVWLCVLVGVLGVYFLEALVLRTHDHDDHHRHKAVGYAALLGLTVHALTAGVSYGVARSDAHVSSAILIAILAHKGFETFSLTTVFLLAGVARSRILATVVVFALVTPSGILIGDALTELLGTTGSAVMTALAAGTFLYVCLCELLVEVFHHREDILRKVVLLVVGIALMVVFEGIGH